jgi:hypothetical protein
LSEVIILFLWKHLSDFTGNSSTDILPGTNSVAARGAASIWRNKCRYNAMRQRGPKINQRIHLRTANESK